MFVESVFDSAKGLAYILLSTVVAGETVDHIRTSTTDVFHAVVMFVCVVADNVPRFI